MKVIAELGQMMNGSVEQAVHMAKAARLAGAHGIKLQLLQPEKIARSDAGLYWRDSLGNKNQREAFTRAGLVDYGEWKEVGGWCTDLGLIWGGTPFDLAAVDALVDADFIKIASGDITYEQLLRRVAETGKQVVLSTGASRVDEIDRALRWLDGCDVVLLACTLSYPTPADAAHLARIPELRKFFGRKTGYSDHTSMPETAMCAAALGAEVLEVHFTLDNDAPDVPDHRIAVNPERLKAYVEAAELGATLRGSGDLEPVDEELSARIGARRSLCAVRDLPRGHVLTEADVIALRPGDGLPPFVLSEVVGKRLSAARAEGEPI